jgi:hypothetical protein
MNHFIILFALFFSFDLALGQSIHITRVSKYQVCARETIKVYYTAIGTFAQDNIFYAQLSDEKGKFTLSQNVGQASGMTDSIAIVSPYYSGNYRIRIFSSDPFVISDTSSPDIHIFLPHPQAKTNFRRSSFFGWIGFAGEPITFFDGLKELPGTTYHWKFNQDAHVDSLYDSSAVVVYPTIGWKNGAVTASDPIGCDSTGPFQMFILSCNPVIPDSTHIVTGTESGTYPYVLVKAGGNYTNLYPYDYYKNFSTPTIFVDSGGMVAGGNAAGIYYVQDNATFKILGGETAIIVLKKKWVNYPDTIYCPDLQFDYSQITSKAVAVEENPLRIMNTANRLEISRKDEIISASVVNIFGATLISNSGRDILSFDLSDLADGVYFAIITAGNRHEIRKIAIVH